jgi:hypothetical protein
VPHFSRPLREMGTTDFARGEADALIRPLLTLHVKSYQYPKPDLPSLSH